MEILWCCLIFLIFFFVLKRLNSHKSSNLPPSPPALPILGHLHLLKTAPHRTLQALSEKYGPVLFLYFGCRPILYVSSPSLVDQCFTKNDIIFANRPESLASKILGYNYTTIGFSPYGDHWRNLRRLITVQVSSSTNLQGYSAIQVEETRFLVQELLQGCANRTWRKINLNSLFCELVYNVTLMMVTGKRWSMENYELFGPRNVMDVCDYIPLFRSVGFRGMEKKLTYLQKERDVFLQGLIDDNRSKISAGFSSADEERKTLVQELLYLQQSEPGHYTDEIIKGIILPMFTAGMHSTALTLEWTMSLLLNHPEELEKARNEIDKTVAPGKLLGDSDLPKLSYLHSIINETLRLYPVGPLLVPHCSSHDCEVDGFEIPRATTLLVNAWAIHRDPKFWEEPTKFKPGRFEGIEARTNGLKFIPFGVGRRMCPGSGMAVRLMVLALGVFIRSFNWEIIDHEPVGMEEYCTGLTLFKAKPLEAMYRQRTYA